MHLLYADETSLDPQRHEFFVYGGVAIPGDAASGLHSAIEELRQTFGLPEEFLLKFNPGPEHLDHQRFIALKKRLMELASEARCVFLTTLSLHKILTSVDEARRGEINRLTFHFHALLGRRKDCGLVLIDRFTDKQLDAHLREKFSVGLTGMPYSDQLRLSNILGFHYSAIGQSHFASLIDVLIGSMRFAVDAFSSQEEQSVKTARSLIQQMSPLFERESSGRVSDLSIHFTPKIIKAAKYRERYQALKDFFSSCGCEPQQEISDRRTY